MLYVYFTEKIIIHFTESLVLVLFIVLLDQFLLQLIKIQLGFIASWLEFRENTPGIGRRFMSCVPYQTECRLVNPIAHKKHI